MPLLKIIIALSIWICLTSGSLAGETKIGDCVIPEKKKTSSDGRCGTWSTKNKVKKGKKFPEAKTILDFRHMIRSGPGIELTALIYVCVTSGHSGPKRDKLYIAVLDGNKIQQSAIWEIPAKTQNAKKDCRHLALKSGMRLAAVLSNRIPSRTRSDHSAKGTWHILGVTN